MLLAEGEVAIILTKKRFLSNLSSDETRLTASLAHFLAEVLVEACAFEDLLFGVVGLGSVDVLDYFLCDERASLLDCHEECESAPAPAL